MTKDHAAEGKEDRAIGAAFAVYSLAFLAKKQAEKNQMNAWAISKRLVHARAKKAGFHGNN